MEQRFDPILVEVMKNELTAVAEDQNKRGNSSNGAGHKIDVFRHK